MKKDYRLPPGKKRTTTKGRVNIFIPTCVFKPYQKVRDVRGNVLRVVFAESGLCGAPCKRGKDGRPQHVNRFGEALCEEHRTRAKDEIAFPDE